MTLIPAVYGNSVTGNGLEFSMVKTRISGVAVHQSENGGPPIEEIVKERAGDGGGQSQGVSSLIAGGW